MRRLAEIVCFLGLIIATGCGDGRSQGGRAPASGAAVALPVDSPRTLFREAPAGTLEFHHQIEQPDAYSMPDIMGSGAALWDYDGDGRLDALLLHGRAGKTPGNKATNRLFRQAPDGKFVDVTSRAGLKDSGYGMGAAVGDVDNDGDLDLYITAYGPDQLYVNNGDGTLQDVTATAGIQDNRWSTAASFFDYDNDGWLDLLVVNYVDYFPASQCEDPSGRPDYCGPTSFAGVSDRLFRNVTGEGRGVRFADVTVECGLSAKAGRGLGALCTDFNGDGMADIFVANDMEPNFLWIQTDGGRFEERADLLGVAVNGLGQVEANMGVAWGDVEQDGHNDLFVTHLRGETNTLFRGGPGGVFFDGTAASGLGAPSLPYTGFGVAAIDVEHDGDLDMAVVNGRVKRAPPMKEAGLSAFWNDYAETNQFFLNDGQGRFEEANAAAGVFAGRIAVGRTLAHGDIDNDGDIDLLVSNGHGPARVYYNQAPPQAGRWLSVRVVDPRLRRDMVGAAISVHAGSQVFRRECNPSTSYLASNDLRMHVGMGAARYYDEIIVVWPGGAREAFPGGDTNQFVVLRRGEGNSLPAGGAADRSSFQEPSSPGGEPSDLPSGLPSPDPAAELDTSVTP